MERSEKMTAEQASSPPRRILLVDDDRDFRWAVGNVLETAGYEVVKRKMEWKL